MMKELELFDLMLNVVGLKIWRLLRRLRKESMIWLAGILKYILNQTIKDYKEIISSLPKVSIDHLGLTIEGFEDLKALVKQGVYVKSKRIWTYRS